MRKERNETNRERPPDAPNERNRMYIDRNVVVRCFAIMAVIWGLLGGWKMLGERWPELNKVSKDQITIIVALVILYGRRTIVEGGKP